MPDDEPRARIEIFGFGSGPKLYERLLLNGDEHPDAVILMDLHSPIRVKIGDRLYSEDRDEFIVSTESAGPAP